MIRLHVETINTFQGMSFLREPRNDAYLKIDLAIIACTPFV